MDNAELNRLKQEVARTRDESVRAKAAYRDYIINDFPIKVGDEVTFLRSRKQGRGRVTRAFLYCDDEVRLAITSFRADGSLGTREMDWGFDDIRKIDAPIV